ncbi:MAG: phage virion morphogenesis protein [candidate division WOR-3 bacterium]
MIEIKIDDKEIIEKLSKIKDKTKLLKRIAIYIEGWTIRLFNKQQDPYGNKWKPLKLNTKRKNSSKILIDTGTLRNSIKANVISEDTIRLGVVGDLVYAKTHQFGAIITPKRAKALTIPLTSESRYLTLSAIKTRYYAIFLRKGVIFGIKTKNSKPIALYYLSKKAEIPARPFLPYKNELPNDWKSFIINEVIRQIK